MKQDERRAPGIRRVEVSTLVELCGNDGQVPAFEARAVELSGRGMRACAEYLPDVGSALLIRATLGGEPFAAEGEVVWNSGVGSDGQFGLRFTALDPDGIKLLKRICQAEPNAKVAPSSRAVEGTPADARGKTPGERLVFEPGDSVRLYIQGLSAPMKARVSKSVSGQLEVGSYLEFLKLGRALELGKKGGSERTEAAIESVTVTVNPTSQIPELIVSLALPEEEAGASESEGSAAALADPNSSAVDDIDDDELGADPWLERMSGLQRGAARLGRVSAAASRATAATLSAWGRKLGGGVGQWLELSPSKWSSERRKTAAPPSRRAGHRYALRPQLPHRAAPAASVPSGRNGGGKWKVSTLTAIVGSALLGFALSSTFGPDRDPPASVAPAQRPLPPPLPNSPADPSQAPAPNRMAAGSEMPTPPAAKLAQQQLSLSADGQLSDRPLSDRAVPSTSALPSTPSVADPYGSVDDDDLETPPGSASERLVTSWSQGRLHLPTLHYIPLDAPGKGLRGQRTANGFSVFIPGRKLLENGRGIQKRDGRILQVKTENLREGARVTFKFARGVPTFRARLKEDHVEFAISAP